MWRVMSEGREIMLQAGPPLTLSHASELKRRSESWRAYICTRSYLSRSSEKSGWYFFAAAAVHVVTTYHV